MLVQALHQEVVRVLMMAISEAMVASTVLRVGLVILVALILIQGEAKVGGLVTTAPRIQEEVEVEGKDTTLQFQLIVVEE